MVKRNIRTNSKNRRNRNIRTNYKNRRSRNIRTNSKNKRFRKTKYNRKNNKTKRKYKGGGLGKRGIAAGTLSGALGAAAATGSGAAGSGALGSGALGTGTSFTGVAIAAYTLRSAAERLVVMVRFSFLAALMARVAVTFANELASRASFFVRFSSTVASFFSGPFSALSKAS